MKLYVFRESDLVGVLEKDEDDVYSFQYASDWLNHPHGFDLSFQLPRQTTPFGNRQAIPSGEWMGGVNLASGNPEFPNSRIPELLNS